MKTMIFVVTLLFSTVASAEQTCKYVGAFQQLLVRCSCQVHELSCSINGKTETFYGEDSLQVRCGNQQDTARIKDCKVGQNVTILNGEYVYKGTKEASGVTLNYRQRGRVN